MYTFSSVEQVLDEWELLEANLAHSAEGFSNDLYVDLEVIVC